MIDLQTILSLVPAVGVIVALVYYTLTIRNQNRTGQAQLLMNLYEAYRSPEFRKSWREMMDQEYIDFDDFWSKYGGQVNSEAWSNWQNVAVYFHGIGVLLKEKIYTIKRIIKIDN